MRLSHLRYLGLLTPLLLITFPLHAFAATQIFLTATTSSTWTVPSDWNSSNNTIEVIGAGGGDDEGAAVSLSKSAATLFGGMS